MKRKGVSLVIGADGLIGRALADYLLSAGESVVETTRRLDTTSERRVFLNLAEDVSDWRPPCQVSVAYLCAAVSTIDDCRRDPIQSAIVNVRNTVALAKALVASGTFVIFPSTTLVYDGSVPFRKENDPVCPVAIYGVQKAEAEKELLALGNSVAVVRMSKVLSPNMPLVKGWIQALQSNKPIHAFSDKVMAPVSLSFVIDVLHRIAELRLPGIIQVSGREDVTYEEAGRHIASLIGASPDLVQSMTAKEGGLQPEAVPLHTTLDTTRLREELGIEPPDVWSTIDSVFGL
jgi:dTDP-4-dehydrorhamnose reductase